MGQHAQRFDAVGAQKGTPLREVVDALKALADKIESAFDSNSREVTGAMQHFEQGLNLIATAPTEAGPDESKALADTPPEQPAPEPLPEDDTSAK